MKRIIFYKKRTIKARNGWYNTDYSEIAEQYQQGKDKRVFSDLSGTVDDSTFEEDNKMWSGSAYIDDKLYNGKSSDPNTYFGKPSLISTEDASSANAADSLEARTPNYGGVDFSGGNNDRTQEELKALKDLYGRKSGRIGNRYDRRENKLGRKLERGRLSQSQYDTKLEGLQIKETSKVATLNEGIQSAVDGPKEPTMNGGLAIATAVTGDMADSWAKNVGDNREETNTSSEKTATIGSSIIKGAGTGAMAGAPIGGYGAVVGAVVGAVAGLVTGLIKNSKNNKKAKKAKGRLLNRQKGIADARATANLFQTEAASKASAKMSQPLEYQLNDRSYARGGFKRRKLGGTLFTVDGGYVKELASKKKS